MGKHMLFTLLVVVGVCDMEGLNLRGGGSESDIFSKRSEDDILTNNELVVSFVVFRHGDRTPDLEELALYPAGNIDDTVFFPHGKKALTLKGKQRAYFLGVYLRKRYNYSINQVYLPDEITVRTTDFARTKMSALAVLAALYEPHPIQKWHPMINWQPIPYDTLPSEDDDMLYPGNCNRYEKLKTRVYDLPAVRAMSKPYDGLFTKLSAETGANITSSEHVFYLDNLFQALENSGVAVPQWAQDVMPYIKDMTKIEYYSQYYDNELIQLASGVLMSDIVNITNAAVAGNVTDLAKLYLYSGHEHNVAALLAAAGVLVPHQPKYGSAAFLELRRNVDTGKYGIMVVYAPEAGEPGQILPIADCGGEPICDYDKFIDLTKHLLLTRKEYKSLCSTI